LNMQGTERLRAFVTALAEIIESTHDEMKVLEQSTPLLKTLIASDDFLAPEFARPSGASYQQYLLHCDSLERFSVVSFVWGPGQATPIHDHTVWGLVGVLRGAEKVERFSHGAEGGLHAEGEAELLVAGEVDAVAPGIGDIHRVSNGVDDGVSISIHVYGGNIGAVARSVYTLEGTKKRFISGYRNTVLPNLWDRSLPPKPAAMTAREIRAAFLLREEIALIDVREEAAFAKGHPLFAAQIPLHRIAVEAPWRLPRRDALTVLYDDGEGLAEPAALQLRALGFTNVRLLENGLGGWRETGYEIFEDVNSYCKAFGELVEHRRRTPSLPAPELQRLLDEGTDLVVLDARRFDEYNTMSIPSGISVPGAELVLAAPALAPNANTTIIVNCAGRTRSLIGAQSLINAGLANKVYALRNGTIGWTLAGQRLETGQSRQAPRPGYKEIAQARQRCRAVAERAGVRRLAPEEFAVLQRDSSRTLYTFDVRTTEAYAAGHIPSFRHAPGGQLIQETDHFAPIRGARIVLADDLDARADMTASWLAQMGWDVFVLENGFCGRLDAGPDGAPPPREPAGRYMRPYEGTGNGASAMQAYLDWEFGLVVQLSRDGSHGFFVI
jgi:predicted metal-dependent enzyme (double-stranded beta helix superfamily)/rhodanese-related sulfurtransferase